MKGTMIVFRLPPRTKNTSLSKFCQRFYGQDSTSHKGKYRYHRHGLLDDIPHRKLIRGVVIIRNEDKEIVERFLRGYSAQCHIRVIELTQEDCEALGVEFD